MSNTASLGELTSLPKADTTSRNVSMDVLRTVSMMLVVMLHVVAPYVFSKLNSKNFDTDFWIGNIIDAFCRVCVPLFVLLSGSFLLGRKETYTKFYMNRSSRILLPLIFWSGVYVLYVILMRYNSSGEWKIMRSAIEVVLGRPFYHLWYLYMLVGLYLVTPVINRALEGLMLKEIEMAAYILLFAGFALNFHKLYFKTDLPFILWFTEYLGYFLMGYVIAKSPKGSGILGAFTTYVLSSALIAALTFYFRSLYFYEYISPLVIVASICLFKVFVQLSIAENLLSRLSKLTLGMYVVHAGVLDRIHIFEKEHGLITNITVVNIFIKFNIVLVVSTLIAYCISRIPILRKVI